MTSPTPNPTIPQAIQTAYNHLQAGQLQQAVGILRQILTVDENQPTALHLLALVAMRSGKNETAEELLRRVIKIGPNNVDAHMDLGNALLYMRRLDEASAVFRHAISLNPNAAAGYSNLGVALYHAGKIEEAIAQFHQAAIRGPNDPDVLVNLGNALVLTGELDKAIGAYKKSISLRPNEAEPYQNLGNALNKCGRTREAIAAMNRALQLRPGYISASDNLVYFMHFLPETEPKTIFEEHRRWNQMHAQSLSSEIRPFTNDRSPDRPLRIGYVSPDMREHSVGFFLEPLITSHDPSAVHVYCYPDLPKPDAVSARLQKHAAAWKPITHLQPQQVAQIIREDQIDILVDLAGHTAGNRMLVFARKPAPIQVTYLGYPNTTGLDTVDYRFTDSLADPQGMTDAFYTEKLYRLPHSFLCYRPPEIAPEVAPVPAIKSGKITFGCFNTLPKLNAPMIELWSNILLQVSGSRIMLKSAGLDNPSSRQFLLDRFATKGIAEDRIDLRGNIRSMAEHLQLYHQIDIALDSYPYHGTTTTCEALWMGVPVITLAGKTHASRVGVSLLSNVGLEQMVAQTPGEYIAAAVRLAGNEKLLSTLRRGLRDQIKSSPLMDAKGFARYVEQAYREMWRRWCSANPGMK